MHRSNSQRALGAEDWKRSLALREQLVREKPEDFLSRRDLAQSLQNLGNWYREAGGHDEQSRGGLSTRPGDPECSGSRSPGCRPGPDRPPLHAHSLWTRPASATISRTRTLIWGVSTLTVDSLPKRARPWSKRSTTWTGWFASNRAGQATGISWRRRTTSWADSINPMARSPGAAAEWKRSRELLQELVREHPADSNYRYNLALILRSLSIASDASGQPAEAEDNSPVRPGARGTVDPGAPGVERLLLRRSPDLHELFDDGRPECSGSVDRTVFAESCGGLALEMLVEAEKAGYFRSAEAVEL